MDLTHEIAGSSPVRDTKSKAARRVRVGDICPRCSLGRVVERSAQHLGRNVWLISMECRCGWHMIRVGR